MATNGKKVQELILQKLEVIESEVKDIRQTDIPKMKIEMAVMKTESKTSAKVVASVVSIITLAISVAIAVIK